MNKLNHKPEDKKNVKTAFDELKQTVTGIIKLTEVLEEALKQAYVKSCFKLYGVRAGSHVLWATKTYEVISIVDAPIADLTLEKKPSLRCKKISGTPSGYVSTITPDWILVNE